MLTVLIEATQRRQLTTDTVQIVEKNQLVVFVPAPNVNVSNKSLRSFHGVVGNTNSVVSPWPFQQIGARIVAGMRQDCDHALIEMAEITNAVEAGGKCQVVKIETIGWRA